MNYIKKYLVSQLGCLSWFNMRLSSPPPLIMLWLFSIDDDTQKEQSQTSMLSKVHFGNIQCTLQGSQSPTSDCFWLPVYRYTNLLLNLNRYDLFLKVNVGSVPSSAERCAKLASVKFAVPFWILET